MRQRLNRRSYVKSIGAGGIATLAGCLGSFQSGGNQGPAEYVVSAGPSGSIGNNSSLAIQKTLREQSDTVRLSVQESAGQAANLRVYDSGETDMLSFANYDLFRARNGVEPFDQNPVENYPLQGFAITQAHIYMMAVNGSGIETYDDLVGKTVWPVYPGASTYVLTRRALQHIGLWDQIERSPVDPGELAGTLEEGRIDAFIAYGANYAALPGWLQEIDTRMDIHALEMEDKYKSQIKELGTPGFEEVQPYGWEQDIGVDSTGSWTSVLQFGFGTHIPEDHAYEVVKQTHENIDLVRESFGAFPNYNERPTFSSQLLLDDQTIHPGAAKFFKENDNWDDSWEEGEISEN